MHACNRILHAVVGSVLGCVAPHQAPQALGVDAYQVVACRFGTFLKSGAVVTLIATLALIGAVCPQRLRHPCGKGDEKRRSVWLLHWRLLPTPAVRSMPRRVPRSTGRCRSRVDFIGESSILQGVHEVAGPVGLTGSKTVQPGWDHHLSP